MNAESGVPGSGLGRGAIDRGDALAQSVGSVAGSTAFASVQPPSRADQRDAGQTVHLCHNLRDPAEMAEPEINALFTHRRSSTGWRGRDYDAAIGTPCKQQLG